MRDLIANVEMVASHSCQLKLRLILEWFGAFGRSFEGLGEQWEWVWGVVMVPLTLSVL